MSRRIFITVAEPSADLHAANLARSLQSIDPTVVIEGLGGRRMREAGVRIHHDTVDRAAMGWRAALRTGEVWKLLKWTRAYYAENRPDLAICCDSWSMNWHFAKLAKERGVPVFYYIAPQTWASREGRVRKLKRWVDHLGCIWPFEEPYFRKQGVEGTYVGHPLFDELPAAREPKVLWDGGGDGPVVGILPGSRKSIVKANFPRQLKAAAELRREFANIRFLAPATQATEGIVRELAAGMERVTVGVDCFDEMVKQCDLCLAVSGTATLHAAAWGTPMIVMYHANRLAWHLVGRWVVKTRTYSMVNLLSGEKIVPEFIPWYGSIEPVAKMAIDYLRHREKLLAQRENLLKVIRRVEKPGASMNAAGLALSLLK